MEPYSPPPDDTARALKLWQSIPDWFANLPPEQLKNDKFEAALGVVNNALLETRRYLSYLDQGGERDADKENLLSKLWSDAALAIRPFDPDFADLCLVKGHGWADPRLWTDDKYKDLPTHVDDMFSQLRKISKVRPKVEDDQTKKLEQYLAYGFGLVFIIVILVLAIAFPEPSSFQYTVFRIVLALAAAGVAAVIPGFLNVQVSTIVRAGGAIAVFVIVFFFSPAKLATQVAGNNQVPIVKNVRTSEGAAGTAIVIVDFDPKALEPQSKLFAEVSSDEKFTSTLKRLAIENPEAGEAIISLPATPGATYWLRFTITGPDGQVTAVSRNPWQFTTPQ